MKRIRVEVICEFEVPDDWRMLAPNEDEQEHLAVDGRYYIPDLAWLEYKRKIGGGDVIWEGVDDDVFELFEDHKITMEYSIVPVKRK